MELPEIVSEEEWQRAREQLLVDEKAHTREGDRIAAMRRHQPMYEVTRDYRFEGPDGPVSFLDLNPSAMERDREYQAGRVDRVPKSERPEQATPAEEEEDAEPAEDAATREAMYEIIARGFAALKPECQGEPAIKKIVARANN